MKIFDWLLLTIALINVARIVYTLGTVNPYIIERGGGKIIRRVFVSWVLLPCLIIAYRLWG